jgi:hypothetical protein
VLQRRKFTEQFANAIDDPKFFIDQPPWRKQQQKMKMFSADFYFNEFKILLLKYIANQLL